MKRGPASIVMVEGAGGSFVTCGSPTRGDGARTPSGGSRRRGGASGMRGGGSRVMGGVSRATGGGAGTTGGGGRGVASAVAGGAVGGATTRGAGGLRRGGPRSVILRAFCKAVPSFRQNVFFTTRTRACPGRRAEKV